MIGDNELEDNGLDLDKQNRSSSSDESTLNEPNEVENLTEAVESLIENNLNIGREEEHEEVEAEEEPENVGAEDNDVEELNKEGGEEATSGANQKQVQLALSRIKTIMKLDPDLSLASKESVFMIAKATVSDENQFIYK